jgi:hypothetical protein
MFASGHKSFRELGSCSALTQTEKTIDKINPRKTTSDLRVSIGTKSQYDVPSFVVPR